MADLRAWETFRGEVADLLGRIDAHIEQERAAARLDADEVRLRKLANAAREGRTFGLSSEFATADTEPELRAYVLARWNGDRQLAEAAVSAAREVWRERQAG